MSAFLQLKTVLLWEDLLLLRNMKRKSAGTLFVLTTLILAWATAPPGGFCGETIDQHDPRSADKESTSALKDNVKIGSQSLLHGPNCYCGQSTETLRARRMRRSSEITGSAASTEQGGMGCKNMTDVRPVFRDLLSMHAQVKRRTEEIPEGIRSETTSENPQVVELIRKHVRQMQSRLHQGQPFRVWDPLFHEIFSHAGKIQMTVEEIPGGVRVTETSADPQVQKLIRCHAQTVSEFVRLGSESAMKSHALPKEY